MRQAPRSFRSFARALLSLCALSLSTPFAVGATRETSSRSAPPRVLLVGVDGADLSTIDRLIASGRKLPNFRKLLAEGAAAPAEAFEPVLSPLLWTSIATGRRPVDHGVWDFLEFDPAGRPVPATSISRKVRAFWNVAAERDVSVAVLGWYASWPAEPVRGVVVSDRAVQHQVSGEQPLESLTFPADFAGEVEKVRPAFEDARQAVTKRFLAGAIPADSRDRVDALARSWSGAETLVHSLPSAIGRFHPAIAAIYLDLPDAAGHLFADASAPPLPGVSQGEVRAFGDVWPRSYEYVDEKLGEILKIAGPETVVIICSDHGFRDGDDRPGASVRADTGPAGLWHRRRGLFLIRGPGVRKGARLTARVRVDDVFPTLCAAAGLPLSAELSGRTVQEAFLKPLRIETVDSYEKSPRPVPRWPGKSGGEKGSEEAVARLKALGYLGGGETVRVGEGGRTARSYLNEGVYFFSGGETGAAIERLKRALAMDEKLHDARVHLAAALASSGDLDAAEEILSAIPEGMEAEGVLLSRGTLALDRGDAAAATRFAERAAKNDPRAPGLPLLRARLALDSHRYEEAMQESDRALRVSDLAAAVDAALRIRFLAMAALGRRAESIRGVEERLKSAPTARLERLLGELLPAEEISRALAAYAKAIELDPLSPWPHLEMGERLLGAERGEEAESQYREALRLARRGRPRELAHVGLALAALVRGDEREAESRLREALTEFPDSAPLHHQLGAILARRRDWRESEEHLARASQKESNAETFALLTAVLAAQGKTDDAIRAGRKSLEIESAQPGLRELLRKIEEANAKP